MLWFKIIATYMYLHLYETVWIYKRPESELWGHKTLTSVEYYISYMCIEFHNIVTGYMYFSCIQESSVLEQDVRINDCRFTSWLIKYWDRES